MRQVLIDHSTLGRFCGFSEISENFGQTLADADVPDMHFTYLVPERFFGHFGDKVSYVSCEHPKRDLKKLGYNIELWHSTQQLFKFRKHIPHAKRLMTIHDLNYLWEKHGIHRVKHIIRGELRLMRSDYITVISKFVADEVRRHCHLLGRKPISVIYNGVRDVENGPRVKPSFVEEGAEFFLAVGQVVKRKNYGFLPGMMKHFPGHRLIICGDLRNRRYVSRLRAEIESSGLKDRIILAGAVSEAEKNWLYAHCEALLMPSRLEGFGLPVIEAMRFGKAVFCSKLTSLPEIGGDEAFYWDNFEPQHMADVVKKGLEAFKEPGRKEREIAYTKKFDYKVYTSQYIELYRKILGRT